jgi:hypothetical protein
MKEISLPIHQSFSLTVDTHAIDASKAIEVDGKLIVPLGKMDFGEKMPTIEIVRTNGAKILYATTSIEKQIEQIFLQYLFGKQSGPNDKLDFFKNELLQSATLTFSFKKNLFQKLINKTELLKGKSRAKLQKNLSSIMNWRNAFAHGSLHYDNLSGYTLHYYSSENKTLKIDDKFWTSVEKCFTDTSALLNTVLQQLFADQNKL